MIPRAPWLVVLLLLAPPLSGCRGDIVLDAGPEPGDVDFPDGGDPGNGDGDVGPPAEADQPADLPGGDDGSAGPDADGAGGDGDTGGDDGGGPADTGADPGPCPATLAGRLETFTIAVDPDRVNTAAGGYFSRYTPPLLAVRPGGVLLGWQDGSGRAHVTPLDNGLQRAGPDVTVPANELRGLAAQADGAYAVLVQRGEDEMAIVGFAAAGTQVFDTLIIGANNHDQEGDKWIRRDWGDNGRLAWYQDRYVVYFGHTMNWGSQGVHQGDLLWFYDRDGNRSGGSWDWGCSHSLEVRLAYDDQRLAPVCLSDCYPSKAICFNHRSAVIHDEPSGNCSGSSDAELGGLVPATAGGFLLSFVSPEGRASRDVALVRIGDDAGVGPLHWLTSSDDISESSAHLARYGTDLLAAWQAGGETMAALVTEDGSFLLGPEVLSVSFNQQTDFVTLPGGDVAWAHGSGSQLLLYRIRLCR